MDIKLFPIAYDSFDEAWAACCNANLGYDHSPYETYRVTADWTDLVTGDAPGFYRTGQYFVSAVNFDALSQCMGYTMPPFVLTRPWLEPC